MCCHPETPRKEDHGMICYPSTDHVQGSSTQAQLPDFDSCLSSVTSSAPSLWVLLYLFSMFVCFLNLFYSYVFCFLAVYFLVGQRTFSNRREGTLHSSKADYLHFMLEQALALRLKKYGLRILNSLYLFKLSIFILLRFLMFVHKVY